MSRLDWVVWERTGRWAAALRMALGRSAWPASEVPRLFEVRQLAEFTERLDARPDRLALLEVERASLGDMLIWLADAGRVHRRARFVVLLDRGVWESTPMGSASRRRNRRAAIDAFREAGASEVVTSPRQLHGLLQLGRRHATQRMARNEGAAADLPIAEWVWASLPWQDE